MPPEWIDYNGHMMDAYYFLAFTEATEAFLDHVGLGAAYQARTGGGIYTAESHLCFVSGVTEGADLRYRTQLLGHDSKRMHVFHQMTSRGNLVATCELMFLHVSDGRVGPMPPEAAAAVAAVAARHAVLPYPDRAGRHIAMPQRVLPAQRRSGTSGLLGITAPRASRNEHAIRRMAPVIAVDPGFVVDWVHPRTPDQPQNPDQPQKCDG